ncbi:Levodione reductase [Lachnellula suecica]|uniref:Levodione reductase n=1 Tax=Lachnellula suecica TaxID=602035 RepID=A0A8T9C8J1_9HELO|nr:Levodione reductase [Lachnellula suecica]
MPDFSPERTQIGAASGMGLAVAQRLIADGVRQIALIDLKDDTLVEASESLAVIETSVEVLHIAIDVSKEELVEQAVAATVEKFGRLDFCFNAAGISGTNAGIADLTVEDLDKVLDINLKGVWLCERAQIRQMLKQEMRELSTGLPFKTRGSIINVGSLCSNNAVVSNLSPYTIAKHGVLGLTKQDALDYGSQGIRVNCFCPGWISTGMTAANVERQGFLDNYLSRVPMGRWGSPEEVAYVASFILSDKASFVTGSSITIDGGLSVR